MRERENKRRTRMRRKRGGKLRGKIMKEKEGEREKKEWNDGKEWRRGREEKGGWVR